MTLEEFIIHRSYLPVGAGYTMTDHIMAMTMYIQGLETKLEIAEHTERLIVTDVIELFTVIEKNDGVQISTNCDKINITNNTEYIQVSNC